MLVVSGSINVDHAFRLPHLPRPEEIVWSDGALAESGGSG